jgi:hypothetical protein
MDFTSSTLLTPHNYSEWNKNILFLLRGLYQITMEIEAYPNLVDEKIYFLKKQDMDFRFICVFVSFEMQLLLHDESFSTLYEVQTKLEVLFRNKEYHEECM